MKTLIYILMVILVMNITFLYAGDPVIIIVRANSKTNEISLSNKELAPVTPKEADFYNFEPRPVSGIIRRLSSISPTDVTVEIVYKKESGILPSEPFLLLEIAPTTPKEAGFEDAAIESISRNDFLAPVTPVAAEFDD